MIAAPLRAGAEFEKDEDDKSEADDGRSEADDDTEREDDGSSYFWFANYL